MERLHTRIGRSSKELLAVGGYIMLLAGGTRLAIETALVANDIRNIEPAAVVFGIENPGQISARHRSETSASTMLESSLIIAAGSALIIGLRGGKHNEITQEWERGKSYGS